jgi:cyanophycinase
MIALGDSGSTPRRRLVHLAKGLGLTPDLIIDQHFRRRDRLGRLLTALSYNPAPLGLGIDEDTAALIGGDGELAVLGAGAVMVVDASGMRFTDSHAVRRGQPVAMIGLKLDFLTTGCRYDLKARRGINPPPMLHLDPVDRRAPERPPLMSEAPAPPAEGAEATGGDGGE